MTSVFLSTSVTHCTDPFLAQSDIDFAVLTEHVAFAVHGKSAHLTLNSLSANFVLALSSHCASRTTVPALLQWFWTEQSANGSEIEVTTA